MDKKKEIIDVEATEVQEEVVEAPEVACELRIGKLADGKIYFNILGPDQNLTTVSGLLVYAEKEMERIWAARLSQEQR